MGVIVRLAAAVSGLMLAAAAGALTTPDYLVRAGQGDLFERESSKLVLETTRSAAVRRFATTVIADHARSTQLVADAAAQAGFHPPPPELAPAQMRLLADLADARGARRDALYLDQQKEAHAQALKLHEEYALTGGIAPIKAAAARIVPIVQQHGDMLRALRPM